MDNPIFALDFTADKVRLGNSYLLTGTDSYLVDKVLDTIRAKLKKKDNVDTVIIYGDEVKSPELTEQLDTFSIFSTAKLIIIKKTEMLKPKELTILAEYFASPSEIQSLAIVAEKIDARYDNWKKIKAGTQIISCEPPPYGGAIRAWLDKALKEINKTMTAKAIEEFINRIELDYYNASNELTKLDLFTGNRKTITENDIDKSLGTTRIGTLIDFYRALGRKQTKQAIEAMDKMLFADWEPLQILFHLNKFYSNIWKILLLKKNHISDNEIIAKHLNDFYATQRKEILGLSHSYHISALEKIFTYLLETDQQFKLSVAEPQILLCNCLLKILDT